MMGLQFWDSHRGEWVDVDAPMPAGIAELFRQPGIVVTDERVVHPGDA